MKRCSKCQTEKDDVSFNYRNKAKGVLQPYCADCQKRVSREWYKNNHGRQIANVVRYKRQKVFEMRQWILTKMRIACIKCGENHPAVLDFHHRDPMEKDRAISDMVNRGNSKQEILAEIEKCDVLCANCHRKYHFEERTVGGIG